MRGRTKTPFTTNDDLKAVFTLLARIEPDKEPVRFTRPLKVIMCPSKSDGTVLIVTTSRLYLHMSGGYTGVQGVVGESYNVYAQYAVETMLAGRMISQAQHDAFFAWWDKCLDRRQVEDERCRLTQLAAKYNFDLVAK